MLIVFYFFKVLEKINLKKKPRDEKKFLVQENAHTLFQL